MVFLKLNGVATVFKCILEGRSDADGVAVRYMDKLDARKALKLKAGCKKKYQNQDWGAKASLRVKVGSRLVIFKPA